MEEQPSPPRQRVPVWVWVIIAFSLVLALQFWRLNQPEQISLPDAMDRIKTGQVERIVVSGNQLSLALDEETVLTTTIDSRSSLEESFSYFGVTEEILAANNIELVINDQSVWANLFTVVISVGPILLIIWLFSRNFRQMQGGGGNSIFGFGRSRAKTANSATTPLVTFDDVAGVEEAKAELAEVVKFLREPERFIQVGARIPKGVLMVGMPGTGKTLLARAVAGEAGVPFFHISGSEFVEMFVGVGASRVRDLFDKAKQAAPSIVFVDELDAVGRQRGAGLGGGNDEREQTLNQILVEMDGFDNETNVIVMAATNRADVLDPALMRPGRFDRKVFVDLPDIKGREAILDVHARGKPISPEVAFSDIARLTAGFSGADLENLINEAAIFAARRDLKSIGRLEFQDAFDRIVMGPERKSRVMSQSDKETIAYHEAGHAVVSYNLKQTDPIQKITIVPRGQAGGYVMPLPEDRFVHSREYFEDQITMTLGGRAAEETFFERITTGAANDLQQATRLARAMVMQYGMSEALGLSTYGESRTSPFLGQEWGYGMGTRNYSEEAAKQIDDEVREMLKVYYNRALQIVQDNREAMKALAANLMIVETMDRPAFEKLMADPSAPQDEVQEIPDTPEKSSETKPAAEPEADLDPMASNMRLAPGES